MSLDSASDMLKNIKNENLITFKQNIIQTIQYQDQYQQSNCLFLPEVDYFLEVKNQDYQQILDDVNSIELIGPKRDYNNYYQSIYDYIRDNIYSAQIKISTKIKNESLFPILKKPSRHKSASQNAQQITQFHNDLYINESLLKTLNEFLVKHKRDIYVNKDQLLNKKKVSYPLSCDVFNVTTHQDQLTLSVILSRLLFDQSYVQKAKFVGELLNDQNIKASYSSDIIHQGKQTVDGLSAYKIGTETFRLFCSSVDIPYQSNTNIIVNSDLLRIKQSEVNLLRNLFSVSQKFISSYSQQRNFDWVDQMSLVQLDIFKKICLEGYQNQKYSQVYRAYMDFNIHFIQNFYLDYLQHTQQQGHLHQLITQSIKIIYPILPVNSYEMLNRLNIKEIKLDEPNESQPQNKEDFLMFQEIIYIKHYLNSNYYKILGAVDAKNFTELETTIFLNISKSQKNYENKKILFKKFISQDHIDLKRILGVSSYQINLERYYQKEYPENTLEIDINFNNQKLNLAIEFTKIA